MRSYFLLLLSFTVALASCKKDDTNTQLSLPAKTQSGQNSFGFLLNNSVWTNYGQVCFPFAGGCRENLSGIYYPIDGDIHIAADKVLYKNNSWNTQETLEINLTTNFQGVGAYATANNDQIGIGYFLSEQGQPDKTYLLADTNPDFSVVVTKIDTLNKIMSGEFSGKLFKRISDASFETSTTDSLVVADGRFDIQLK